MVDGETEVVVKVGEQSPTVDAPASEIAEAVVSAEQAESAAIGAVVAAQTAVALAEGQAAIAEQEAAATIVETKIDIAALEQKVNDLWAMVQTQNAALQMMDGQLQTLMLSREPPNNEPPETEVTITTAVEPESAVDQPAPVVAEKVRRTRLL